MPCLFLFPSLPSPFISRFPPSSSYFVSLLPLHVYSLFFTPMGFLFHDLPLYIHIAFSLCTYLSSSSVLSLITPFSSFTRPFNNSIPEQACKVPWSGGAWEDRTWGNEILIGTLEPPIHTFRKVIVSTRDIIWWLIVLTVSYFRTQRSSSCLEQ